MRSVGYARDRRAARWHRVSHFERSVSTDRVLRPGFDRASFERPGFARQFPRSSTESRVYAITNLGSQIDRIALGLTESQDGRFVICAMKNSQEVSNMRFTKASASFVLLTITVLLLVPGMLFAQSATKGAVSG